MSEHESGLYAARKETTPSRHRERARFEQATVHAILDEGMIAHVAFVADAQPQILPTLYLRRGNSVYLHSSTGARLARMTARQGAVPVALEVTLLDEVVLARSAMNHSINYRSVVAHGEVRLVGESAEKAAVLEAFIERLVPGRSREVRPPSPDELRETAVLELSLDAVGAKVRVGDPVDDDADLALGVFAGRRPLTAGWEAPIPSADLAPGIEAPEYLAPGPATPVA